MTFRDRLWSRVWYRCAAAAGGVVLAAGSAGAAWPASAATHPRPGANPYAPAYHHPYRHGAVPTIGAYAAMRSWQAAHPQAAPAPASNLHYGGGIDGIGVTTGAEK